VPASCAAKTGALSAAAEITSTTLTVRGSSTPTSFVRPTPTPEIKKVDTSAAAGAEGVLAVLTGDDVAADGIGGLPVGWGITSQDGSPMVEPPWPILAQGRVRYVGDAVAVVIAATRNQAKDAAELVSVDYAPLPAIIATGDSIKDGVPQVWDDAKNNICFDWGFVEDNKAKVDAAFQTAHHVTTLELTNNRCIANAMEPRAAIGDYNPAEEHYTLYTTSQNPHVARLILGAFVLAIPEEGFRVVAPESAAASARRSTSTTRMPSCSSPRNWSAAR